MNSASPLASVTGSMPQATTQSPLADLHDIAPPLDPGFWPPPFWFYGLIALGIVGLIFLFIAIKKQQGPKWYRSAKQLLKDECQALKNKPDMQQLAQVNQTLKRIAYKIDGRNKVAALQGIRWCEWLDQKGNCKDFTSGAGSILGDIYNPKLSLDDRQIKDLSKVLLKWLDKQKEAKTHKGFAIDENQILVQTQPENKDSKPRVTVLETEAKSSEASKKNELADILSKVKKDIESLEDRIKGRHD